jgi:hypothetical protein
MRRLMFLVTFSLMALLILAPAALAQDVVCQAIDVCPKVPKGGSPPPSEDPAASQPSESPTTEAPPPSYGDSVGGSTQSEGNTLRERTLPPTGGPAISSVVGLMLLVGIGALGLAELRRTR